MKLEIHIPQVDELNTNLRQLIDTLNDLAVVGINAVKREQAPTRTAVATGACGALGEGAGASIGSGVAIGGSLGCAAPSEEKPKRQRKIKVEAQEQPDNGTGAEVIAYAVAEPQLEPTVEPEPQSEQASVIEAEPEPYVAYTLADCTALAAPLQSSGKLDEAKAWLKEHGADRLKDLDPSHYGAFITFAKGLLG